MTVYEDHYAPFTPGTVKNSGRTGVRRSVQELLALIDTTDLAWPEIAAVLNEFADAGVELDKVSTAIAVKLGKTRWAAGIPARSGSNVQATLASTDSIVYYIRRGKYIKIGTTTDPHGRFEDLLPDEILAYEPGGLSQENLRHEQFRLLRSHREYFTEAPELLDHISQMRALYGDPDPSWPTNERPAVSRIWVMPAPRTSRTMTAAEASEYLGIKEVTIRGWRRRGRLPLAGKDEKGRLLFNVEHLIALRGSMRQRLASKAA